MKILRIKMKEFILFILLLLIIIYIGTNFVIKENFNLNDIPIDAVITYVNNNDPSWKSQINLYNSDINSSSEAKVFHRFKSHDEIKYCILSINKFAPFFRTIYLVVSGPSQVPVLPDIGIPIKIIYHNDFYINKQHLPTFNSTSIEANIHNIPGLSEFFVYFNDDCMLGNEVKKEDFVVLTKENKIKVVIQLEDDVVSKRGNPENKEIGFYSAWKNTNKILDNIFPETVNHKRLVIKHVPQIQRKSTHKKLYKMFNKQFQDTSISKFRGTKIHNTSAGLAEYYELYNGGALIKKYTYISAYINDNIERNKIFFEKIKNNKPKFINIQSTVSENNKIADKQIKDFLNDYYAN